MSSLAYVPATCANQHVYRPSTISVRDAARYTTRTVISLTGRLACPECGASGAIAPGTYVNVDGVTQREDA